MDLLMTMKALNDADDPEENHYPWPHKPKKDTKWEAAGFTEVGNNSEGLLLSTTAMNVLDSSLTTVFLPVVYILIFIVGLPTNTLAIWVFIFRTKKKHPASILLVNLALADLLFIIWLPLKIAYHFNGNNWIFGEPLCKVLVAFFYGNMYCSTIFIACISVQRYWVIVHPFSQQKRNNRAAVCVSVCVWFTVWLITVPLYLYDQTANVKLNKSKIVTCHDVPHSKQSHIPISYFLTMGIVGYVVPCVVCTVAYVRIFLYFRRSRMSSEGQDGTRGQNKRKAIILMTTVLVMFLEFRKQVKNTLMCRSERTAERKRVTDLMLSEKTKYHTPDTESSTC
ncbi:proteinase-activated receptor 2-like isoform X2 [Brachyhypopomus gauderio]|uniref:proteinase-activated receptor 2-like isoform X2 n=1 Tax=Brachyhypopomus gauderio TaxID=698409 RepID=UPI0040433589